MVMSMPVRISIRDVSTGNMVDIDLEPTNTVDEIIESVGTFWDKEVGAYVLSHKQQLLRGEVTVSQLYLNEGDQIEFLLDPEGG